MTKYAQAHDMDSWQHDPRIAERGFVHPWQSTVAAGNGEDAFLSLVDQHLRPDSAVLDLGCGHGELTLQLARRCQRIVGLERHLGYLELAKELMTEQQVTNAQFLQVNLAGADDEGRLFAGIPLPDNSIDLFINRRGPILKRYLAEALRVARPGAVIVGLHPAGTVALPIWCHELPEPYRGVFMPLAFDEVAGWVTAPLQAAGITEYSLWWSDVPEYFRNAHELYGRLWGAQNPQTPAFQEIEPVLQQICQRYNTPRGLVLRHRRLLWQVQLPN